MKKYILGLLLFAVLIFQISVSISAQPSSEKNTILSQMILDSPESLEILHSKGLQIHDVLDSKWKLNPLEYERLIRIDEKSQRVIAFQDGLPKYVFTCSTRAPEFGKSVYGIFKIIGKYHKLKSKMYDCWMFHALHIYRDVLIHGSNKIRQLGRPASHGCIRLHPKNASTLYHKYAQKGDPVEFRP